MTDSNRENSQRALTSNVVSVTDQYAALADLRREYCASGHAYQSFETWLCIQVKRLRAAHETPVSIGLLRQIYEKLGKVAPADFRKPEGEIMKAVEAAYYLVENALIAAAQLQQETVVQPRPCQCATYCMIAVGARFDPQPLCRGLPSERPSQKAAGSPSEAAMQIIAAVCHSVSGTCCHVLKDGQGPCTIENCSAVRGYLGAPNGS